MSESRSKIDQRIIVLHPLDNVAVSKQELAQGAKISGPFGLVTCVETIPRGHKLALSSIGKDERVFKYNQVIGFASKPIAVGSHVHTHNVEVGTFERVGPPAEQGSTEDKASDLKIPVFQGYKRANGRAGTRNFIVVLSTVNCSATVSKAIADTFRGPALKAFPNVDSIVACTHDFGCMTNVRLQKVMAGYARHPNVAGFLMLGLGCENNNVGAVASHYSLPENELAHYLIIQQEGGTRSTIDKGIEIINQMLPLANLCQREPIPVSELVLGLECGGSDVYSSITANPALGKAADILVGYGGTAVLSETPELFGAEHLLIQRANNPELTQKLRDFIDWWQTYAEKNGMALDNNLSEGNKRGGLTTIQEKSLGAVAKAGTTQLCDVIGYADPIITKGLNFMDTPGYDPSSVTGMIAGGANIICFTTGRGSAFGSKPTPSIKLASNTPLFENMPDDMDINAGLILDGVETVETMGETIFNMILEVASGKPTKSELNGYGDNEFAPWHIGAVL